MKPSVICDTPFGETLQKSKGGIKVQVDCLLYGEGELGHRPVYVSALRQRLCLAFLSVCPMCILRLLCSWMLKNRHGNQASDCVGHARPNWWGQVWGFGETSESCPAPGHLLSIAGDSGGLRWLRHSESRGCTYSHSSSPWGAECPPPHTS